jgi:hypothetical protein
LLVVVGQAGATSNRGDPRYPPELRLFFSVDIEGSTQFKNAVPGRSTWGPFFLNFFSSFPATLKRCEADVRAAQSLGSAQRFEHWKSLGDELIFSVVLESGFDAYLALCAARDALILGSQKLREHRESRKNIGDDHPYPVHLKGTVWLAGFPMKNMKVPSPRPEGNDDFIGPSMDLGFRIAKVSSPWRMAVTTPLAWIASKVQYEKSSVLRSKELRWVYLGRQTLKGIDGNNVGYPVFCIDVADSTTVINSAERLLLSRDGTQPSDVMSFCETQFRTDGTTEAGKHGRPFILKDSECGLGLPDGDSPEKTHYWEAYNSFLAAVQPAIALSGMGASQSKEVADEVISAIDLAVQRRPS